MPIFPPPPGANLSSWRIIATTPVADKKYVINSKVFLWRKVELFIYISNWIQWEIGRVDLPECFWQVLVNIGSGNSLVANRWQANT